MLTWGMLFLCGQDGEEENPFSAEDQNHEITESMRLEMEYNSDRAW